MPGKNPPEVPAGADALPGISVITLGVAEMPRAIAFYRRALAAEPERDRSGVAYFHLPGTSLALYPRDALARYIGVPAAGTGFTGVALSVNLPSQDAVDRWLERARDAGARIVAEAETVAWGGYCAWFGDLDGHCWELVWNPKWGGT